MVWPSRRCLTRGDRKSSLPGMRTRHELARTLLLIALILLNLSVFRANAGAQQLPWLISPPLLLPEGLHRLLLWSELQAMVTFFERTDVLELSEGVQAPRAARRMEIGRWARSMGSGWQASFAHVRDQVSFVPYDGSIRGASGALESGAGNALDQTLLLRELLAAQGIRGRLVHGRLAWGDAAELVLGAGQFPAATPNDPWPRWVEIAADHWWLEAEIEGAWVGLDPAFPGSQLGEVRGELLELLEEVPAELLGRLRIEILHSDLLLTGSEMHSGELIGSNVEVFLESMSDPPGVATEDAFEGTEALRDTGGGQQLSAPAPREAVPVLGINSGITLRGHLFVPKKIAPETGPWMLHLVSANAHLEAGPFEEPDLRDLSIRITVEAPRAPVQVMQVPWGSSPQGRLTVAVGGGPVSTAQLGRAAEPLYESLEGLASVELAARDAMRPPLAYADASIALHQITRASWRDFTRAAPAALGWAVLSSVDRVSARTLAGRVLRPGLRLAAVRWQPPEGDRAGAFTVYLDDPIVIGQLVGAADPATLQAAYGLLQSAVVSQVMHRVASHAPATAFDVTLRAIGTGQGLDWWTEPSALPESWPPAARALASDDLDRGFVIMSSSGDDATGEGSNVGWWSLGPLDGTTRGGVVTAYGFAQGEVLFAETGVGTRLDEVLASLPVLHRGLRWLANLTGSGVDGLDTVPFAACASASIAAETMIVSMPDTWARPDVALFCGGQ